MKINKTGRIMPVYENINVNKSRVNKKDNNKDGIEISERARDYQFAINKLKEIPEIRTDKVNKIKKEIQSGNYNIEGKEIVDKIYENIEFDKKV